MRYRTFHVLVLVREISTQKGEDSIMTIEMLDSFAKFSPNTIRGKGSDELSWVSVRALVRTATTYADVDIKTLCSKAPVGF